MIKNISFWKQLLALALLCLLTKFSFAQNLGSLLAPEDDFLPEEVAYVVTPTYDGNKVSFTWTIAEGYYLYKHQFGLKVADQNATRNLEFELPPGIIKFDKVFEQDFEVYYGSVTLSSTVENFSPASEMVLLSQGCADAGLCYAPRTQYFSLSGENLQESLESRLPEIGSSQAISPEQPAPMGSDTSITTAPQLKTPNEATTSHSLITILVGALIGGMILNLMPCVFPVLSLKALSLASGNQREHRINGWSYTFGVVLSFAAVAAILIIAKSAGTTLGWGFQLQQPAFIAALIYLFFLLAMNLFGLFEIGTSWMGVGQKLTSGKGLIPSFFTGVLAAVVASPCTAPFMATAIGFTLTQGPVTTLIIFIALGFGMALPYLVLSHNHLLASKLPAPGPWMDVFKQFLAFPLLFTCVWLLVVLGNQTSPYASALIVGGMVSLGFALWLVKHQPRSTLKWAVRFVAFGFTLVALKTAIQISDYSQVDQSGWQVYNESELEDHRRAGQAVFIDLTADWCITCKINERVALVDEVMNYAAEQNIIMMRGDWTKNDPEITRLLHNFDRNGVPLYLMYPAKKDSEPEVLPQILTKNLVMNAMVRATEDSN